MALTLAQAKVGMSDAVDQTVIDLFIRNSKVLGVLPFVDAVTPQGVGSTLTYNYVLEKTPSLAAGRALNADYVAGEAIKESKSVDLKIFGGAFKIDRVLAKAAPNEIQFQIKKKVQATTNLFHNYLINGNKDASDGSIQFDGLATLLADTDNEIEDSVDVSGTMTDEKAFALVEAMNTAISKCIRKPDQILLNSKAKVKVQTAGLKVGYITHETNQNGVMSDYYDGIELVDMGQFYNGTALVDIIPVDSSAKTTPIYFVCYGEEELCGVSMKGEKVVSTYLPDLTTAEAVKTGAVEAVWAVALKNTKAAAVLTGVKVA